MTTMREVACHASVSIKTVSRVVNEDPQVAEATRQRVQQALDELDYIPNTLARAFRHGRDPALGIAVPDIADPFFASLVRAAEMVAGERGYPVVVTSIGYDPERERANIEALLNRRISGLLTTPVSNNQRYLEPWQEHTPVVFVDREPSHIRADHFVEDDIGGARVATEHMLKYGHRRIAYFGDAPGVLTSDLRKHGYESVLMEFGEKPDPQLIIMGDWSASRVTRALKRLFALADPPTAIFSANARINISIVDALHDLGRADVALVGFGDVPLATALRPALSVIDQDPRALGRMAAERVMDRLEHPNRRYQRRTVLPVSLIQRGSGETPGPGASQATVSRLSAPAGRS